MPFRVAVGVALSAGVTLMLTSVLAAISAPLFTAFPFAETVDVPLPVWLMVSLGVEGGAGAVPELPPVLSPEPELPPVLLPEFEPLEPLPELVPVVMVPSALMVVCSPYSFSKHPTPI